MTLIALAPMAGVTDMAFRERCVLHGCDLTFTEMVSAKGLMYGSAGSERLLMTSILERPCGAQLFGSDPQIMGEMAKRLCDKHRGELSVIDINMGCPVRKIVTNGEGSALMRDLPLASHIIGAVSRASSLPVSVKLRKGFDAAHVNAVEFARMAEQSGAARLTVHGRTREQMYSGRADWDIIAQVKQSVSIPVIGNGDVFTGADAVQMLRHTGCDGVMVARGAEGNPFIFEEIRAALSGAEYTPPTAGEKLSEAMAHAARAVELYGERAIVDMRKHAAWYVSGMRGAAALRTELSKISTLAELSALLCKFTHMQD